MRSWRTILGGGLHGAMPLKETRRGCEGQRWRGFGTGSVGQNALGSKVKFGLPGLDVFIEIPAAKVKGIDDPYHP